MKISMKRRIVLAETRVMTTFVSGYYTASETNIVARYSHHR